MNLTHAYVSKNDFVFADDVSWICPRAAKRGEWYFARAEFDISERETTVLAVLPSYYTEAYINGKIVARFCERSYIFDTGYKAVDITDFAESGKNTLAVIYYETGESKRCGFAAQINCGNIAVLKSGKNFKMRKFSPMGDGANFFIEGTLYPEIFDARLDDFAPAFYCGFDDRLWENAECVGDTLTHPPFFNIHQDKLELQSENPVYAKSFVSFEKSLSEDGIFVKLPSLPNKKLMCETMITAREDFSFAVDSFGGAELLFVDGKSTPFGSSLLVTGGKHRIAVFGASPNLFIKGSGFSLSSPLNDGGEWAGMYTDFKSETPFFPWNGYKKENTVSKEVSDYLCAHDFTSLSSEQKAVLSNIEVSHEANICELISEKKYFSVRGAITNDMLEASLKRHESDEELAVSGIDSIFGEKAEMTIKQSEKDVTFILDFGEEKIGGIYFDVDAASGAEITVNAFEVINGKGARLGSSHQTLKYICKNGKNVYLSHIRRGFRYLFFNIKTLGGDVVFHEIGLSEWRFNAEDAAKFSCSDDRLNEIYKMSVATAESCMIDAYVDCPGYEQNIWTGDARVTSLVNLNTMGCYDFNARYLKLISESLSDYLTKIYRTRNPRYIARKFLTCATFPTFPEGNIPIWSFMWTLSVADHYDYTGDRKTISELLPAVEENLRRAEELLSERGLLSINGAWNLIEWAYNDVSEYGEVTANSMILSYCFKRFSEIEAEFGNVELSKAYAFRAESIKTALNKYCWDDKREAYVDTLRDKVGYEKYVEYYNSVGKEPLSFDDYMGLSRISVQTNTFAVLYGIAEGNRKSAALKILVDSIEDGIFVDGTPAKRSIGAPPESEAPGGIVRIGSPFFMYFALKTLFINGYDELAVRSIRREWGDMLDSGVTTCTETFNTKKEWKTRSVAHGWSSSPAAFIISDVLGVKPLKPGFEEFTVTPYTKNLDFAKGSVPTPHGKIEVEWHRGKDGNINISCTAPVECKRV